MPHYIGLHQHLRFCMRLMTGPHDWTESLTKKFPRCNNNSQKTRHPFDFCLITHRPAQARAASMTFYIRGHYVNHVHYIAYVHQFSAAEGRAQRCPGRAGAGLLRRNGGGPLFRSRCPFPLPVRKSGLPQRPVASGSCHLSERSRRSAGRVPHQETDTGASQL